MKGSKKVTIVLDGMAGSCGKGKVEGYLALSNKFVAAITNAMPNSGHKFVMDGKTRTFRNIPVSSVNPKMKLFIGAGAAIDMEVIKEEYERNKDLLEGRTIIVHPEVPLIKERHKQIERETMKFGSTFSGCGPCIAEKIQRSPLVEFFKGYKNVVVSNNFSKEVQEILDNNEQILLEGAQGVDLDINYSGHYPYTTSRQCSASQMLADSGISPFFTKDIIMIIRPYPIRISNKTELGFEIYSGDYGNSQELTWDDINFMSGSLDFDSYIHKGGNVYGMHEAFDENDGSEILEPEVDFTEYTTVTKQKRRVFCLDLNKLKESVKINRPTQIFLNFFQQLDVNMYKASGKYEDIYVDKYRREFINWLESELDTPITFLGTGPDNNDIIDRRSYVKKMSKIK